jgi:hypothetical protein
MSMVDLEQILMVYIPDILGILLAVYASFTVLRLRRKGFLSVVRGSAMIALIVAVAARLSFGAVADSHGGMVQDLRPTASMLFIVVVCWLSILTTSMASIYVRYVRAQSFRRLFTEKPFNLLTLWAAFGLAVIAFVLWAAPMGEEGVRDNPTIVMLVLVYLVASIVVTAGIPTVSMMRNRSMASIVTGTTRTNLILLAATCLALPVVDFVFRVYPDTSYGLGIENPSAWIMVLLFGGLLKSISHPDMATTIVSGETETARIEGFRSFDIPRGIYVIEDEKAYSSMNLFAELVTQPLRPDASSLEDDSSASATLEFLIPRGLMVTRESHDIVKERYQLNVTPVIWLTESPGDLRIAPTSLAILTDTMIRFMESNPNGIIVLTGLEYLVTFNDFHKLIRALDTLSETVWITKTRLLIGIDPRAFDGRELALLERDKTVVKGKDGIEELKRESAVMETVD